MVAGIEVAILLGNCGIQVLFLRCASRGIAWVFIRIHSRLAESVRQGGLFEIEVWEGTALRLSRDGPPAISDYSLAVVSLSAPVQPSLFPDCPIKN